MSSYGKYSIAINNGIRDGDAGRLPNNQAVRNYAHDQYRAMGLNERQAQARMNHKDAGHIVFASLKKSRWTKCGVQLYVGRPSR